MSDAKPENSATGGGLAGAGHFCLVEMLGEVSEPMSDFMLRHP
jgi:hypothetical protein